MSENTLPDLYESGKNSNLEMEYSGELEKDFKDYNTTDSCSSEDDLKEKNPEFEQRVKSPLRLKLESWLNKNMKIEMTDGRTLIGIFLCTDRDRNIILGSCSEYLKPDEEGSIEEPRLLGLAMVPGGHIVSINIDQKQMPWMQRSSNVN